MFLESARNILLARPRGLTLIELMVSAAIIGILSNIAITGYHRYQAKSRQSEAKLALVGVYSAQKTFYSEYSAYFPDFGATGFSPEGHRRFYQTGWATPIFAGVITGYSGGNSGVIIYGRANIPSDFTSWNQGPYACGSQSAASAAPMDVDNPQGFYVMSIGIINIGRPCDRWSIDHVKRIQNEQNGL